MSSKSAYITRQLSKNSFFFPVISATTISQRMGLKFSRLEVNCHLLFLSPYTNRVLQSATVDGHPCLRLTCVCTALPSYRLQDLRELLGMLSKLLTFLFCEHQKMNILFLICRENESNSTPHAAWRKLKSVQTNSS